KVDGFYELSDAAVWTSPDGLTWSRVPHDEAVFARSGDTGDKEEVMLSVTAGGPGLVAVGSNSAGQCGWDAAVWTSADGITWVRVHDEEIFGGRGFQWMQSVVAAGPGLVAVGGDQPGDDVPAGPASAAAVWASVDGTTWMRVAHDEEIFGGVGGQAMSSVTAVGGGLVAVGNDGGGYGTDVDAAAWTSDDGLRWSRVPHDETVFGDARMHGVIAAGSAVIAVGGVASETPDSHTDAALVWTAVADENSG
ncbi:MAG: hypothetical protein ACERLM_02685, partial [Acidimicrobiales bacterium]